MIPAAPVAVIHQMLPGLREGDAITNHALAMQRFLRQWGCQSDIFTLPENTDPAMLTRCRSLSEFVSRPGQAVIYHHGVGSPLAVFARDLPDTVIVDYHNITPPQYVEAVHPRLARGLAQGLEQLSFFTQRPLTLADSEYNRRELLAAGYTHVEVVPCIIPFETLDNGAAAPQGQAVIRRYDDGRANWLFVGRMVPNKCQADLVRLFAYVKCMVDPAARLLLVGSSADTPGYRGEIERLIKLLKVEGVELCGLVDAHTLGAFYRVAAGYISMSEHEGFGIPLLEAMYMGVPVIAYAATAVPETMANAGILFHHKRYEVVAEVMQLVQHDTVLRERLVAGQRRRVAEFVPKRVASQLRTALERGGILPSPREGR